MKLVTALVTALGIFAFASAATACPWSSANKDTPTVGS